VDAENGEQIISVKPNEELVIGESVILSWESKKEFLA
jgi:hypothetical protein